jgi:cysteinyl-tRNA synthetase
MSLRVYNTLTRQKELFIPVNPGKVGIYLCGPTVYKPPHIGHMVGPVIFDAVKRYLRHKGFEVTWVINITDVDDKLIEHAAKRNTTVQELADQYTREYLDCLAMLGIDSVDRFPRASDHINEIIEMCQKLIARGMAYAADGNVWFDVTKDPDYGKLSNRRVEEQESGLRDLEGSGKRHPADFALWKAAKPGEPQWDSPWGPGRPGWHIECSAMSMKYLGETFDMHGGGMDLMFPHHENELAQSESCTGKPFAKFWMHNGLTRIKTKLASGEWADEKMSGSLGNVVSAKELIEKHGAELLRYLLLSTHYRRPIEFSNDVISAARKGLTSFHRTLERVERIMGKPLGDDQPDMDHQAQGLMESPNRDIAKAALDARMKFLEMMDDDFNTAGAIAVMHEFASQINAFIEQRALERDKRPDAVAAVAAAAQTFRKLGLILGLFRQGIMRSESQDASLADQLMKLFIELRQQARKEKNFALADNIRNGLLKIGITLEDRPEGTIWRRE